MGQFIVIEGTDGSGKATQTALLAAKLRELGYKVSVFDFPQYGKKSARFLEMYLRGEFGPVDKVGPYVASLFYAIDRHFAAEDIAKAIESEDFVITNRYTTANMGHQGGKIKDPVKRGEYLEWLEELEHKRLGIPRPNKVVFLYLPPGKGQELVDKKDFREYTQGKKRDIHEADQSHLNDASEAYQQIARERGWIQIGCLKEGNLMSKKEIASIIWDKLAIIEKSED